MELVRARFKEMALKVGLPLVIAFVNTICLFLVSRFSFSLKHLLGVICYIVNFCMVVWLLMVILFDMSLSVEHNLKNRKEIARRDFRIDWFILIVFAIIENIVIMMLLQLIKYLTNSILLQFEDITIEVVNFGVIELICICVMVPLLITSSRLRFARYGGVIKYILILTQAQVILWIAADQKIEFNSFLIYLGASFLFIHLILTNKIEKCSDS